MDFKIDYVFPWVNPLDKDWQDQYKKAINIKNVDQVSCRFKDWNMLPLVFKSIATNAPWINKIYLIVSSESQIPDWLNTCLVEVITHDQIIPKEYLPTFNSQCIEMFLKNIPGLSEHFIYGNDDCFFLNPSKPEDWFTEEGVPKLQYKQKVSAMSPFQKTCKKSWDLINSKLGTSTDWWPKLPHVAQPMLLSSLEKVSKLLEKEMAISTHKFRHEDDLNQYIYTMYQIATNEYEQSEDRKCCYFNYREENLLEELQKDYQVICLNDTETTTEKKIEPVKKFLNDKFSAQQYYII